MTTSSDLNPPKLAPRFLKAFIPLIVLLMLILIGLTAIKLKLDPKSSGTSFQELEAQSIIPDHTLTRLDGTSVKLSELKGKVFLINFWATWCDACMDEMPSLVQVHQAYKDKGFEILGINLDDNPEVIAPKVIKQFGIQFTVLKDPDNQVAALFDVHAIPLTVVLNQNRQILLVKDGEHDWNSSHFRSQLEQWLNP